MPLRLLLWICAAATLASCQSRSEQAATYNDRIVDQQFQLIQTVEGLDTTLLSRDSLAMHEALVLVRGEVIRSQRLLDSIGSFQEDTTLLAGARQLFSEYNRLTLESYPEMIDLLVIDAPTDTLEHLDNIYAIQGEIHAARQKTYESFFNAQQQFGKKFNLEFEDRPTHD